jgi:ABC-type amino acid transport substrate-binding protein
MMNKKYLAVALASLAVVTVVAGCGSSGTDKKDAGAKEEKVLRVGTEPTFPPFEFTENEKYVGFDMDYAQAIADKMGYKMEIKSMGFDALIPALKSGQIDMIAAGMDATPERKQQVAFTDVYFRGGYCVVVRKDNTDITGFDSLKGRTVGGQIGTKPVEIAKEKGANVKQYDANSQGWLELKSGTCDAVVIDNAVAMYFMTQGGDKDLKIVGEPILSTGSALAFKKENTELLDKVNKAITELKKDGTYASLYKKWFGKEPPAETK